MHRSWICYWSSKERDFTRWNLLHEASSWCWLGIIFFLCMFSWGVAFWIPSHCSMGAGRPLASGAGTCLVDLIGIAAHLFCLQLSCFRSIDDIASRLVAGSIKFRFRDAACYRYIFPSRNGEASAALSGPLSEKNHAASSIVNNWDLNDVHQLGSCRYSELVSSEKCSWTIISAAAARKLA